MKGKEYIFSGEARECAFPEPFIKWQGPTQELPESLQKIGKTGDDRSFVLLSAMIAERYLGSFIECVAPGFEKLNENRDFTFSLKIEFLRSLRLIPNHILRAVDLIRRIRNTFAHHEDVDPLDYCDPKLNLWVAVGTIIADRPPHRSVRALLTHTALTSDAWRRSARWDKDGPTEVREASGRRVE